MRKSRETFSASVFETFGANRRGLFRRKHAGTGTEVLHFIQFTITSDLPCAIALMESLFYCQDNSRSKLAR
jgi:hypothetical protein